MAIVGAFSVKGSPGVTTTVMGLTMAWAAAMPGRSAIAVDADPVGGDTAAGFLRGAVAPEAGMLALATARGVDAAAALDGASVHLRADGSARVVVGVPDSARAGALPLAWDVLLEQRDDLHTAGCDVLIDAGRLGANEPLPPWILDCDLALLTLKPSLPAVIPAHRCASAWPVSGPSLELVVLAARSPYRPTEIAGAVGRPLAGTVPFDPELARVYSDGTPPPRTFGRSEYARGLFRAAGDIGARAVGSTDLERPTELDPDPGLPVSQPGPIGRPHDRDR